MNSGDFWLYNASNVLDCRFLLTHIFLSQFFDSYYFFQINHCTEWINELLAQPCFSFSALLFYFCSSAKWQKRRRILLEFCVAVVSFPQWIFGSFTFERNFCLHIDMALKNIYISFEIVFSFYCAIVFWF